MNSSKPRILPSMRIPSCSYSQIWTVLCCCRSLKMKLMGGRSTLRWPPPRRSPMLIEYVGGTWKNGDGFAVCATRGICAFRRRLWLSFGFRYPWKWWLLEVRVSNERDVGWCCWCPVLSCEFCGCRDCSTPCFSLSGRRLEWRWADASVSPRRLVVHTLLVCHEHPSTGTRYFQVHIDIPLYSSALQVHGRLLCLLNP